MSPAKVNGNNAPGGEMKERAKAIGGVVSFFEVPLVCAAAPHLGCGTLAKSILSELEGEGSVREAWLNRKGTVLAVVWAGRPENQAGIERAMSILRNRGLKATKLEGSDLHQAIATFGSGHDWHRAIELDRLSEEEAGVIAARLVRRLGGKVTLKRDQANRLIEAMSEACARILTNADATTVAERLDRISSAVRVAGRELLDDSGRAALEEVVALGHRPLPGEA